MFVGGAHVFHNNNDNKQGYFTVLKRFLKAKLKK